MKVLVVDDSVVVRRLVCARLAADGHEVTYITLRQWPRSEVADVPGVEVRSVPLLMTDVEATAEMARRALELAGTTVA
jgi:hypothetical protein